MSASERPDRLEYVRLPAIWKYGSWVTTVLSFACAVAYLTREFRVAGTLQDDVFVVALLGNSLVAAVFGAHLHGRSVAVFRALPVLEGQAPIPHRIFGSVLLGFTGVAFALIISGWSLYRAPWGQPVLNAHLAAFLFVVNIQIGMGIGALSLFWHYSAKSLGLLQIRILNLSRPDIVAFLDLVSLTVVLVGALCTVAMLSLMFSVFSVSLAVVAFSAFSFLMVLAAYFVPVFPLVAKLRMVKFRELDRIEKRIDQQYAALESGGQTVRDELENLLLMRETLRKIQILPPNGQISFLTAISALVVSFLPSIVQNWSFVLG